jgi:hypothetical protein
MTTVGGASAMGDEELCGRYRSQMVRTVAKQGPRTGQPLWRCSDFDCPEIVNIDESAATPLAPVAGESAQARNERERSAAHDRIRYAARFMFGIGGRGVYWVTSAFLPFPPYPPRSSFSRSST